MPRNSAGTYTLPAGNPVVAGTTIDASWANDTMSDMANELTNSLSRTGAGGMLAPFRVADGSVTAPGLGFTNETNTGLYRAGTGELWFTVGGVAVAQITGNGLLIPSGKRLSVPTPVNAADATPKSYVDVLIGYADFYLGPKSSDPTTNNSGGALTEGATYWSTTLDQMRVYNGTNWEPMPSTASLVGQTFSGTGAQTAFTLANPSGPAINLEVFISGVRQVPTTDYSVSGTTLTFTTAPPSGTDNVFVRYAQLIAMASADSNNVSFVPAGTGAVTRTAQAKMRDSVSVLDFGADPTGVSDSTTAFTNAQAASDNIYIPPGTYLLDEFKQQNRKVFTGGGLNNTFIKQANAGRPAWWCVAKTGVYTQQIIGAGLSGVWFLGASGSTVASMIVEAVTPYVVAYSNFDIAGSGGFNTLEVKTGGFYEVYSCVFKVYQDNPDNRGGSSVGSTSTGVICGAGVYNEWYLNIAKAANGKAFISGDWGAVFRHAVSEGSQTYNGQHNLILDPSIELWSGAADTNGALQILGASNRVVGATLTNVPSAKCGDIGIALNGGGGVNTTILGFRVYGTHPLTAPIYPMSVPAGNSGTIADAQTAGCQFKLDAYVADSVLKNFQFVGNVSELVSKYAGITGYTDTFTPTLQFAGASAGITYTVRDAFFQRVGRTVFVNISINLSSKGSSTGAATISGLPFASRTAANTNQNLTLTTENVTIPSGYVGAAISSASTSISLNYYTSATGSSGLTDTQFANNSLLRITGSYLID